MVDIRIEGGSLASNTMSASSLFYERVASTLAKPVPANTEGYTLFRFEKTDPRPLRITSLGTSQHDNVVYHWIIDGSEFKAISGPAAVGTILKPYVFPRPIRVYVSIELRVDNLNLKAYPNDAATSMVDRIPFECVVNGIWE
jgi:hypothetical protein